MGVGVVCLAFETSIGALELVTESFFRCSNDLDLLLSTPAPSLEGRALVSDELDFELERLCLFWLLLLEDVLDDDDDATELLRFDAVLLSLCEN